MRLAVGMILLYAAMYGQSAPDARKLNEQVIQMYRRGKYAEAIPLAERVLMIAEEAAGPDHPDTAVCLNNLGLLYVSQGAYAQAEPLYARALSISEKALGTDHPNTAMNLNNLAELYRLQEDYDRAEPLQVRALAIREKALGPDHPDTAASLNNLALLYNSQGKFDKAEPLYARALSISEKALGPDHPNTALSLNNLAHLYESEGAYARAEPLFVRALTIRERKLEPYHPDIAVSLNNLAELYAAQGEYDRAEPLFVRALAITEMSLGPEHPDTLLYMQNLALVECAMGKWKEAIKRFPHLISNRRDREDLAFGRSGERRHVSEVRENLLAPLFAGSNLHNQRKVYLPLLLSAILSSKARVSEEYQRSLESLQRRRLSSDDQKLIAELQSTWRAITALKQQGPGESGLEVYRRQLSELNEHENDLSDRVAARSADFRHLSAEPTQAHVAERLQGRVLVEIIRTIRFHPKPNRILGDPLYGAVLLFPDERIEAVDLGDAKPIDDLIASWLKTQETPDNVAATRGLADELGRRVLAPIARLIGSNKEWYLSADGAIRLVPLNALRVDDKYAAEKWKIWPIGSGRDLLDFDASVASAADDLIVANPDFGRGTRFTTLTETEEEAAAITEVFPNAQILDPEDRSKDFLMKLESAPRILHFSTHAFYESGEGDPTLRSGIALNGANENPDKGILTAKEVQMLRLQGTKLVVLSACDTGLGEVSFADGLAGLQRSLRLAGARTQMLTQWPVNAAATRDFMGRFYGKLAAGKTKGDAWLETQRDLIKEGVASHYWAPFVLFGDPGPLGEK